MKVFYAFLCLIWGLPAVLWAEPIQVRSGEHGGFTRLVLHLPAPMKWRVKQDGNNAWIEFPDQDVAFDLSQAFQRIDRNRIAGLSDGEKGLNISLACECDLVAFEYSDRMLVADVRPRSVPEKAATPSVSLPAPHMPDARKSVPTKLPIIPAVPKPGAAVRLVAEAENRLLQQLSRAASLGLVNPVAPVSSKTEKVARPDPVRGLQDSVSASQVNLDAHSGLSEDTRRAFDPDTVSRLGVSCISDEKLDIQSWKAGEDFNSGLMALRRELGGEIDPLNRSAAFDLAKHYLYFGLAPEAQTLLKHFPESEERALLWNLSQVVDGTGAENDWFQQYETCDSAVALWAFLSSDHQTTADIHPKTIVHSFSELPLPLQSLLGPVLATALSKTGYSDAAGMVLRIVERATETESPELLYAEAQVEHQQDPAAGRAAGLKTSAEADAVISPDALVELVNSEIRAGRAMAGETINLLESYLHQYRGTKHEPELRDALILAYAGSGDFDNAWKALKVREARHPDAGTWQGVFDALLEVGTDFEFLRYGTLLADRADRLQPSVAQAAARRFLKMGFPDLAQLYVATPMEGAAERERRILQAEIAFQQGNVLTAKAGLLGLSGEDVDALMARMRQGDSTPLKQINKPLIAPSEVSLAQGHSELQQSQTLRERLEKLLAETEIAKVDGQLQKR